MHANGRRCKLIDLATNGSAAARVFDADAGDFGLGILFQAEIVIVQHSLENVLGTDILQADGDRRLGRFAGGWIDRRDARVKNHIEVGLARQGLDHVNQRCVFKLNEWQEIAGRFGRSSCVNGSRGRFGGVDRLVVEFLDFFIRRFVLGEGDQRTGAKPDEQQGDEFGFHLVVRLTD